MPEEAVLAVTPTLEGAADPQPNLCWRCAPTPWKALLRGACIWLWAGVATGLLEGALIGFLGMPLQILVGALVAGAAAILPLMPAGFVTTLLLYATGVALLAWRRPAWAGTRGSWAFAAALWIEASHPRGLPGLNMGRWLPGPDGSGLVLAAFGILVCAAIGTLIGRLARARERETSHRSGQGTAADPVGVLGPQRIRID